MSENRIDQYLELKNGHHIGYAEYGAEDGTPLLHNHGTNGSRYEAPPDKQLLLDAHIRLIVPDRPGHGFSSPQSGRSLRDWADNVGELLDHLSIGRCTTLGYSSGGPHALALAHYLPGRIDKVGLVCSLAPFDRPDPYDGMTRTARWATQIGQHTPLFVRVTSALQTGNVQARPRVFAKQFLQTLPQHDRTQLQDRVDDIANSIKESYRVSGDGAAEDIIVTTHTWGFHLSAIQQPVIIWQGERDTTAVPSAGAYLHANLPNSELIHQADAGHGFFFYSWDLILNKLLD